MKKNYAFSRGVKNPFKPTPVATVYFDRNVFGDICELRGGISADNVRTVEQAVQSDAIVIPAGITLFEETIRVIKDSDEKYEDHVKTVLNLVSAAQMVKPPSELLKDDCKSYAENSS